MTVSLKHIVDAASKLLSEIAGKVYSDLSLNAKSKKVEDKIHSYHKWENAWSWGDKDLLKLIAIAELQRENVQSSFMNLKGVDPTSAAFNLAFTSLFSGKDLMKETRDLMEKRVAMLEKLITHTEGIKAFGKSIHVAKLPEHVMSLNASQHGLNALAVKRLDQVCDKNNSIYRAMLGRRKNMLSALR